jgi:tRNA threonylcarbamoyladenosine biosynthesis protein TsaE
MEIENAISNSEDETIELGTLFAKRLKTGDVVALYGPLGSGKTEFIKGVCNYFNVEQIVSSPTFTIMNQYYGEHNNEEVILYHVDLYRIKNPEELAEIGFNDCIYAPDAIKLVEWAEKAENFFPKKCYQVKILTDELDESKRTIRIELDLSE